MDQPDINAAITTLGWLELIKRIGGFMVIAGVAIEVGGDWISTPFHKKVEDARQLELSRLNNDTARLSAEAETARLELAKFKAGRSLNSEQQSRIVERLKQFAGQQYNLSVSADQEAIRFIKILDQIFQSAGWIKQPPLGLPFIPDISASMSAAVEPGVRILVADSRESDVKFVARVLEVVKALTDESVEATAGRQAELEPRADAIHIRVGSKPR